MGYTTVGQVAEGRTAARQVAGVQVQQVFKGSTAVYQWLVQLIGV